MKKTTSLLQKIMLLFFLAFSLIGRGQHFSMTLDNLTATSTSFEVDLMLTIDALDAPPEGFWIRFINWGINFNPAILNGGDPCCGALTVIEGSVAPEMAAWYLEENAFGYAAPGQLRIEQYTAVLRNLMPGTYRVGRIKLNNHYAFQPRAWDMNVDAAFSLQATAATGLTTTRVLCDIPYAYYETTTLNSQGLPRLTLGYTQEEPMHVTFGTLATSSNKANASIVTAHPNPFQNEFKLNMSNTSTENVQIKVYDMSGKLVDNYNVEANAVENFSVGQNYASGLYNIKVSQGDKTQVLRMIKQ